MGRQMVGFYEDVIPAIENMRVWINGGWRVVAMASPKNGVMVVYEKIEKKPLSDNSCDLMDDIKNGKGLPPLPEREWE